MKILAIALNTFREAVRNQIVYSVVLFAFVLVGVSSLFGSVTIGDQLKVIKDFGLFSLSFCGAVLTMLCGTSLLQKELKNKTIYNILSKPVSRSAFILGKHLGLSLTVCSLISVMGLGLVGFCFLFEGHIDLLLFQALVFIMMELVVIAALTIFFSSVVVTTTLTALFTLGAYVIGRSLASFQSYISSSSELHNPALANLLNLIDKVIPDLSVFNINNFIVYGTSPGLQMLRESLLYCIFVTIALLILGSVIFSRREFH